MNRLQRFLDKPKTPLVVDRRFDIYFIVMWTIFAAWAIVSAVEKLPSLNSIAAVSYQLAWSAAIGTSATVALVFAILGFIPTKMKRVSKEKVEMYAAIILSGFIFVYPCVILYSVIVMNNPSIAAVFVLSVSCLITPIYRVTHLWGRIKNNV